MKIIRNVVLNHTSNWGEKNLLQLTSDSYTERNRTVMNGKYVDAITGELIGKVKNLRQM